jgi:hypothetical protein
MKSKRHLICVAMCLLAAGPAFGVVTNVAPTGVIVDSSDSIDAWLIPARVLDGQTAEAPNGPAGYWLAKPGSTTSYFILDLRHDYTINSVVLYNTHNRAANDCGTAQFSVTASESVGPNFVSLDRYYPLNGDLTDHSSNKVDAVSVDAFLGPIDAVYSNDVPAKLTGSTRSLSLSGQGESVEILDPPGFVQPLAYSYSLWVKFVTNDVQTALTPTSLVLRSASAGQERATWSHQLRLTAGGVFEAYLYDGALRTVTGTTAVQPGVWYHVATTAQNGGLLHLYVNGVEEGKPVAVNTLWQGGGITEIGTGSGGGFLPAPELIDDVAIWYSSLSPDRIKLLSQGTSPLNVGGAKGLVLVNPRSVVSGTLNNVTGQAQITPNAFNLSTPVTARFFRFDALSMTYPATGTNSVGLNELQLMSDVSPPTLSTSAAIDTSWPANPFASAPLVSPTLSSPNWTPVSNAPVLVGTNFTLFQPAANATAFYALPGTAITGTTTTNVARGGAIIEASSTYGSDFSANHLIDGLTDEAMTSPSTYWITADAATTADFILDLQRSYSIKSVSLFNTHNRQYNDRGTAQFELWAGDGMSTSQTQTNVVADRYYPFDGDVTDHSGNLVDAQVLDGPNGNVIDGVYTNEVPSVLGSGKSTVLTQTGARIEIPDVGGASQPTAYTLSLWVKFADLSLPASVIVRTASSGAESNTWSHQIRVTETGQFQAYLWDGAERAVTGITVAQPNIWYHVAATALSGDLEHLYVNGTEEGIPAALGTIWNGGSLWSIGTGSGAGFAALNGEVDDLAIWFNAISGDAVKALATGTKPTAQAKVITSTTQMVNARLIASGTLSDVSSQDSITADVFPMTPAVTARLLQFKALSGTYASGHLGLNEIQVTADVGAPSQSIGHAVLLSWPHSPFNMVLQSSPDGSTWTTVTAQPTLVVGTWQLYQPVGYPPLHYRVVAQ